MPTKDSAELREKLLSVNLIRDHKYTPKNVVLVTLEDIEEIFRELAPYTMAKLDDLESHTAAQVAAARIDELRQIVDSYSHLEWIQLRRQRTVDGGMGVASYVDRRLAHLTTGQKERG